MASLVHDLQRDAMEANCKVGDLLRKAFVVARKLNTPEFAWIRFELKGYPEGAEIPEYRELYGALRCFNPVRGWMPLNVGDPEIADMLSKRKTIQSIGELESLLTSEGPYHIYFEKALEKRMMEGMEFPMQPAVMAQASQIHGIVDTVRNIVLEWALRLESEGIIGEGMAFSRVEKITASSGTLNIQNFIHNMMNSQIQQESPGGLQINLPAQEIDSAELIALLKKIRQHMGGLALTADQHAELAADIDAAETQAKSPKPKRKIISTAMSSIKSILEHAAGGALAAELIERLEHFP